VEVIDTSSPEQLTFVAVGWLWLIVARLHVVRPAWASADI
jgi:hypothetical protein